MEMIYKWARLFAVIFIAFFLLVTTSSFVVIAIKGIDSTTVPMLITTTICLVPLVLYALSFRLMKKGQPTKKRHLGLGIFLVLMVGLFIFSLYAEREYEKEQQRQQHINTMQKESVISNTLENFIHDMEEQNLLDVSPTSK